MYKCLFVCCRFSDASRAWRSPLSLADRVKGYCVTCTHESDIRPPSLKGNIKTTEKKVQGVIELFIAAGVSLDDLGIQEGTSHTAVKPLTVGCHFPGRSRERETDLMVSKRLQSA